MSFAATVTQQQFDAKNMEAADPRHGFQVTCCASFLAACPRRRSTSRCSTSSQAPRSYFVEWIPNNVKSAICDIPTRD